MKLKSLLLGSAAAMMTVSGANAADAVFAAEPEPMEYVKVCDTYGSGFFYIPGTETCLRIGGDVRTEFIHTDNGRPGTTTYSTTSVAAGSAAPAGGTLIGTVGGADIYSVATTPAAVTTDWAYRARIRFDARNETDWGTLRALIRLDTSGHGGSAGSTSLSRAVISLGGLRLGYTDSFFTTNIGYGWQKAANDGYYSFERGALLDYTFAANGFSATIGVQDMTSTAAVATGSNVYDAYAGFSYSSGSFGRIAATVIYDASASEAAWNASVDITAIPDINIHAWYEADNGGTGYVDTGSWAYGVDVAYNVNSNLAVWAGYSDGNLAGNSSRFGVGAIWGPVTGLSIRPEAVFGNNYSQVRLRVVRSF